MYVGVNLVILVTRPCLIPLWFLSQLHLVVDLVLVLRVICIHVVTFFGREHSKELESAEQES
jgi:hypothetical protein